jgi:hypothetical protein
MHTVIYGTDIQFWPTLAVNDDHWVFEKWWAASDDHWVFEKWWAASDEQRVMTIECLRSDEQRVIGSEWRSLSVEEWWAVRGEEWRLCCIPCLLRCFCFWAPFYFSLFHICRVGHNRIYTPYMPVCLVIFLPIIPYIHRMYMVLANPTYIP